MSDLISRSALIEYLCSRCSAKCNLEEECCSHVDAIENAPAVDAVPVVHGRWILLDECSNEGFYCSRCHKKVYRKDYANQKVKSNYCPNCLAKMDGGEDNG